jgi:predicted RNase H-like HicB family nuclease
MSSKEFIARIHEGEDGSLWAEVLDLPGCFASGETLDELRDALEEAISMCLEDASAADSEGVTRHLEIDEMRVKIPA